MNVFFTGRSGGLSRSIFLRRAGESGGQAETQPRVRILGSDALSRSKSAGVRNLAFAAWGCTYSCALRQRQGAPPSRRDPLVGWGHRGVRGSSGTEVDSPVHASASRRSSASQQSTGHIARLRTRKSEPLSPPSRSSLSYMSLS